MSHSRPRPGAAHLLELARSTVPPMNPAGIPFVITSGLLSLLLRRVAPRLGGLGLVLTAFIAWFFREPRRVPPTSRDVVVAAADGTVSTVGPAVPPVELGLGEVEMTRISVFLSIFDVHVQRTPVSGRVEKVAYRPGKFLSADLDKASDDNERNTMLLVTEGGRRVVVTQIAGLIARRIVCSVRSGDTVAVGDTYGLIRFGSRVDVYLPMDGTVLVRPGQRTIGGETVLAQLPGGDR